MHRVNTTPVDVALIQGDDAHGHVDEHLFAAVGRDDDRFQSPVSSSPDSTSPVAVLPAGGCCASAAPIDNDVPDYSLADLIVASVVT